MSRGGRGRGGGRDLGEVGHEGEEGRRDAQLAEEKLRVLSEGEVLLGDVEDRETEGGAKGSEGINQADLTEQSKSYSTDYRVQIRRLVPHAQQ